MRYLYSAFLRPKQPRSATKIARVNGITQFLPIILTLFRKHSPDGITRTRQNTSDIAYYSTYRPRKDDRPSWPSWLTYSGRLSHISGHTSTAGRSWDRKVRPSKTNVLPLQRNQPLCLCAALCIVNDNDDHDNDDDNDDDDKNERRHLVT